MKRSKRKRLSVRVGWILAGLTAFALTTSLLWAQPPTKGEPIKSYKLTWISAFPKTHSVTVGFQKGFVEKVTELSQGRLVFDHKGGPETIPFPDTGKAIQNKVVDMGFSAVGNYEQMAPGLGGAILREISFDEERQGKTVPCFKNPVYSNLLFNIVPAFGLLMNEFMFLLQVDG